MKLEPTEAVWKLNKLKKRIRVVQGGTYAGKTYGILIIIINYLCHYPNLKATVVAESVPALRDGAINQFVEIMENSNRFRPNSYHLGRNTYRFANGSVIQFKSFDRLGKAKAAGKRDILFLNEANHLSYPIADALMIRTSKMIWIDFNPDNAFWVHQEILTDTVNCDFLLLKYTDNEKCPKVIIDELLRRKEKSKTSAYWENWCRVYIDGEIGNLEGVVFPNWEQVKSLPYEEDEEGNRTRTAKYVGTGLDFGFTNDPTAIVDIFYQDEKYYLVEKCYRTGLTNQDIAKILHEDKNDIGERFVIADSAEPKSIKEIGQAGIEIKGASKGADSVKYGINLILEIDFCVTDASRNVIDELRKYRYEVDRDGNSTNKPIDYFNHAMDAFRYWASYKLKNKGDGEFHVW